MKLTAAVISEVVPGKDLQDIETLSLQNKDIDEIEDISYCVSLRRLDLKENNISDISGIINNKSLLWLSLASNKLKRLTGIHNLPKLNVLNLSHNRIKVCTGIEDLTTLQALVLNDNKISTMRDIVTLQNLNTLVISGNRLADLEGLEKLKNLKKLSAANNQITKLPTTSIHEQWGLQLTELRLAHNLLTSVPSCIKNCPALKILDMGHNQLFEWKAVEVVGTLKALTQLNFAGNAICEQENYHTIIRDLCPLVKILDGIKIVDDLRRRKKKRKREGGTVPLKKKPRVDAPEKTKQEKEKQKSVPVAPMVLRGRVSTGKRIKLDDSDSEEEEHAPAASEDVQRTEIKKTGVHSEGRNDAKQKEKNYVVPSKAKTGEESGKEVGKVKKEPLKTTGKEVLKQKETGEYKRKVVNNSKQKKEDEILESVDKRKSSGVVKVVQVKKKPKAKFSVDELLDSESTEIGTGTNMW